MMPPRPAAQQGGSDGHADGKVSEALEQRGRHRRHEGGRGRLLCKRFKFGSQNRDGGG